MSHFLFWKAKENLSFIVVIIADQLQNELVKAKFCV